MCVTSHSGDDAIRERTSMRQCALLSMTARTTFYDSAHYFIRQRALSTVTARTTSDESAHYFL